MHRVDRRCFSCQLRRSYQGSREMATSGASADLIANETPCKKPQSMPHRLPQLHLPLTLKNDTATAGAIILLRQSVVGENQDFLLLARVFKPIGGLVFQAPFSYRL